jgi:hypothetical protein
MSTILTTVFEKLRQALMIFSLDFFGIIKALICRTMPDKI